MQGGPNDTNDETRAETLARALMRQGLSDEQIEARTGLAPAVILSIRVLASVEETRAPFRDGAG